MKTHTSHSRCLLALLLAFAGALPVWARCAAACPAGDMACCEKGSQPAVSSPCCASHSGVSEHAVPATPAARQITADTPLAPGTVVATAGGHHDGEASAPFSASPPPPPRVPSPPLFLLHSVLLS